MRLANQDWDLSLMEGITTKISYMHVVFLSLILLKIPKNRYCQGKVKPVDLYHQIGTMFFICVDTN